MNASEAARIADTVRDKKEKQRKKNEEKREKEAAAAWRKERANFLIEFYNRVEEEIEAAVKSGKKSCVIHYLGKTGGAHSLVEAESIYQACRLRDIVEKVFQQFREKGFSIKVFIGSSEHYVSYDTSDETYHTYHTDAEISW